MAIFGKTDGPAAAPSPAEHPVAAGAPAQSVIGAKARFVGEISGDEDIAIHGRFEGNIDVPARSSSRLGGEMKGDIHARSVVVGGRVQRTGARRRAGGAAGVGLRAGKRPRPQGGHRRGGPTSGERGHVRRRLRPGRRARNDRRRSEWPRRSPSKRSPTSSGESGFPPPPGRPSRIATRRTATTIVGLFPEERQGGRGRRGRGREEGVSRLEEHAGAPAGRDPLRGRRDPEARQGEARAPDDARDGQGPGGDARRRAGSDRHGLPRGRRGTAPLRVHDAFGAPEQVGHVHPPARGRLRVRDALELPDGDPGVEVDGGADRRQHDRDQAGDRHARFGRRARARLRGGGPSRRRLQRRHGLGRRGRGSAGRRTPTSRSSRTRARPRSAATSRRPARRRSSASTSRWAARTRSSSWTTRTSTSPWTARSGAPSARPASAARRRRGCSCTGRSTTRFSRSSSAASKALRVGNGLDENVDMGPCISEKQRETVAKYVEIGKAEGAKLLTGGEKLTAGRARKGLVPRPDRLRRREREDARRLRGDLRPGHDGRPDRLARGGDPDRQLRRLRTVGVDLHAGRQQGVQGDATSSRPESSTSTRPRSAPRSICPSAASRTRATATARRASPGSTSSRSGSRSTSTSPESSRRRRSTRTDGESGGAGPALVRAA